GIVRHFGLPADHEGPEARGSPRDLHIFGARIPVEAIRKPKLPQEGCPPQKAGSRQSVDRYQIAAAPDQLDRNRHSRAMVAAGNQGRNRTQTVHQGPAQGSHAAAVHWVCPYSHDLFVIAKRLFEQPQALRTQNHIVIEEGEEGCATESDAEVTL